MIPILNQRNVETGQYKKTLADEILPAFDNVLHIDVTDNGKHMVVPVWRFIERYLRIKDKSGKFIAFELNPAQVDFYKSLCEQKLSGQPMRINILKARQLGFSTFIAAILFTLTILVPNQTACIIADTAEHATNLFKKYKFFYSTLPEFFQRTLPIVASNAKELTVNYGMGQSSTIRVLVQGENAGRSDTCQYLHLSEVAFWQDIENTTTSVLQTVDDNNPNSIIIYETTANGVNDYKAIWDEDVATGSIGYKALFYAWYLDPNYRTKYWGFELFQWEKENQKKFNLDLEQISWYRTQYNKMHGNLAKLRQEMPTSPIEAFIVSGTSVFNMELLLQRKAELMALRPLKQGFFTFDKKHSQDGQVITISNIKWIDSETGSIKIYEEPKPGNPYVANNDPAQGGEDYFCTQVINNHTGIQAAVYHKNKCDADDCAYQLYCLGTYYNNALISGETNTTPYLLKLVRKCGYRFIYQDTSIENLSTRYEDRLGYKTKQSNRPYMIELFAEAFRDNPRIITDYETICEMEAFQIVRSNTTGREKAQAIAGKHDDMVMAMCGVYLVRGSQSYIIDDNITSNKLSMQELEARVERNRRNLNQVVKGNWTEEWD